VSTVPGRQLAECGVGRREDREPSLAFQGLDQAGGLHRRNQGGVWSLELTAFWMMFFDGNIAAPPTMTVFSPDISLFIILSCALTGATTAAVRASAAKAAGRDKCKALGHGWSPDGLSGRRTSAGDGQQRRLDCDTSASLLRRATGAEQHGFRE